MYNVDRLGKIMKVEDSSTYGGPSFPVKICIACPQRRSYTFLLIAGSGKYSSACVTIFMFKFRVNVIDCSDIIMNPQNIAMILYCQCLGSPDVLIELEDFPEDHILI